MSRRVLLASAGAALLWGAAAGAAEGIVDGMAAPPGARSAAASSSARLRSRVAPPRPQQPRLPYGQSLDTLRDGPKVVALTIDDGPSPEYTPQVLRVLRQYRVTASFSMIGREAASFPGVAREVAAAGHMIVNHTWDHGDLGSMSAAAVRDEIARATDAIHAATGKRPDMFRAPYGIWAPAVFRYCAHAGLTPLDWSVDPRDWSRPGVGAIVRGILSHTRTGSIILEHDGGGDRSETVAALKIWLPRLLDAGYRFTTP